MGQFSEWVSKIDSFVWGPATLILLVGTGLYLTVYLNFLPWRNLVYSFKETFSKEARKKAGKGDISAFSSLMAASAATIGTGNIVGVTTAMYAGGPGALVWMLISACFGLTTKFAECMLSIKYREVNENGEIAGGPMYVMKNAFKNKTFGKILAFFFAVFTALATFGIGNMTQANSVSSAVEVAFGVDTRITGLMITVLTFIIIIGGIKSISKASDFLVPIMAVIYMLGGLIVIIGNISNVPQGISQILTMAFNPKAVGGGVLGTITVSFANAVRYGIARGCFSNEAGLGSAAITAPSGSSEDPVKHGYIFMMDVFFDTIIICTITGLVLASSGVLGTTDANGVALEGIPLITAAFSTVLGSFGKYAVSIGIILFAFSTIIGWEYHGEKAVEYLFRKNVGKSVLIYRFIFSLIVYVGATTTLQLVWNISDIMNALMAIPNLISLLVLSKEIKNEVLRFQSTIESN
ncbi:MAG: sodium:alanine symporter family protein [Solobacterium sp.]|nr:sodium:alanine symporter family protein [Solobacterium sp.]